MPATNDTFLIGGDLPVNRLGLGTMPLTGPGAWGEPTDRAEALRVLRRAVDLGVNLIDTADAYGPHVSENLIAEALHPYPGDLVIATKGGLTRQGPNQWAPLGRPEYLRQCVEMSLRRLRLETIDLYQLHRIDPRIPLEDQVGALATLQAEGKIRHLGLSKVTIQEIERARRNALIATVQNRYNLEDRASQDVLDHCTEQGLGFLPWFPLAQGRLARPLTNAEPATKAGQSPSQLALAGLLGQSTVMLPIPGTSKVHHLEENLQATTWGKAQREGEVRRSRA
ncbi:aldo/keto reductase [Streptosporangium sp. NPDC000509]|uniref:aldo/keto reductase n=1 Tax=Streptosporangium sp. NPDC000509 TaxID=3366186 RepID=UPI00368BB185